MDTRTLNYRKTPVSRKSNVTSKNKARSDYNFRDNQSVFEFILQYGNSPISIFDHTKDKFVFVNDKFTQLTGLSENECYSMEVNEYEKWIHACDLVMLLTQVRNSLFNVCKKQVSDHSAQLTFLINFRIRENSQREATITILAQCSVLKWNEDNTPALTLDIFSDITNYCDKQKMILTVSLFEPRTNQWKTILTEDFVHNPDMLSRKEKEIVRFMIQDKSATEISKILDMSFYTVRAHWRNILLKTKCKTQKELKQLFYKEGWV